MPWSRCCKGDDSGWKSYGQFSFALYFSLLWLRAETVLRLQAQGSRMQRMKESFSYWEILTSALAAGKPIICPRYLIRVPIVIMIIHPPVFFVMALPPVSSVVAIACRQTEVCECQAQSVLLKWHHVADTLPDASCDRVLCPEHLSRYEPYHDMHDKLHSVS